MEVKEIEIRVLRPNNGEIDGLPRNPRKISKKQLEKLKKSLADAPEMLRLRELICVEHPDGPVVIAGNQRLEAAKALGWKTLPCKVLPADTPAEKLREYAIKDNLPFGEDDWEVLANEWDTAELEEWGMSVPEKWKSNAEATEDDFDEGSVTEPVCERGDIWQLGNHRLMCGDSTDAGDVALLMDGEKATLFLTDPPYGVSYGDKNRFLNSVAFGKRIQKPIENDHHSEDEMFEIWKKAFSNANEVTEDCMSYYVFGAQGGELWKTDGTHHFYGGFKTSVFEYDKPQKNDLHPTMKPVPLISELIINSNRDGEIVLDLFGGSGTTLIAAEQLNRKCYMMELDPHYCDVIIARWEKLTGKTATKIN